jgi:hypothetical protein
MATSIKTAKKSVKKAAVKKAIPKKKAPKVEVKKESFIKTVTTVTTTVTREIDWSKVKTGYQFKARYLGPNEYRINKGDTFEGIFYILDKNRIYLVQDVLPGSRIPGIVIKDIKKLSWIIKDGSSDSLKSNYIEILDIKKGSVSDDMFEEVIQYDSHRVVFNKGTVDIGCRTISNDLVRKIASKLID